MPEDTSASGDHEAILYYEAGKRIEATFDKEKIYGTVTSVNVGISGETAYTIITDQTKDIIILNHKLLEASIKACELGSNVVIELSDNDDNDNNNSIDNKKKNAISITTAAAAAAAAAVPLPYTYTAPLKNSNNKNRINSKHDINQKVENLNVINADNNALHS